MSQAASSAAASTYHDMFTSDAALGPGNSRKRGFDADDTDAKKKSRKQRASIRKLKEMPSLGYAFDAVMLGNSLAADRVVDMFPFLKNMRQPRFMRSEYDQTGHKDEYGPCAVYDEFVSNPAKMLQHAQLTHAPLFEEFREVQRYLNDEPDNCALQHIYEQCSQIFTDNMHFGPEHDYIGPCRRDFESKLFNCLQLTSHSMRLFKPKDQAVSSVFFPQNQNDLQSQIKVWGDDGGFAGASQCSTFWMLSLDHAGRTVPTPLLQLVTLLSQGLRGAWSTNDCNQWPTCATHYTEPQGFHTHKKKMTGTRICTSDTQRRTIRRHYDQLLDIDCELLDKLIEYHQTKKQKQKESAADMELDSPQAIASNTGFPVIRNPLANANGAKKSTKDDDVLHNVSAQHSFNMFLITRFLQAVDKDGIKHVIKIDMLRIHPRFVGIDPIVGIKNCLQALPELALPLKQVLEHMADLRRGENSFNNISQLFDGSTNDDIVDLLNEQGLNIALGRFAQKNKLHIQGKITLNINNEAHMATAQGLIDGVNTWRRHQYHEILRESESEMSKPHLKDYPYSPFLAMDPDTERHDAIDIENTEPIPLIGDISFHWRSVPLIVMHAVAMSFITNATEQMPANADVRKQEMLDAYTTWIGGMQYQDSHLLYFPVAGCPVHEGVYMKIDMQGFAPNEKMTQSTSRDVDGNKTIATMMQPSMVSPCIQQYLSSHLDTSGTSNYACFFEDPTCIPDRQYMLDNFKSLPPTVWSIHEHMTYSTTSYIEGENGRQKMLEDSLQQCYGLKTNSFIFKYQEMVLNSDVDMSNMRAILAASFRCFYSCYEDNLGLIASCPFDQYRYFAAYILTLDQHARNQAKYYSANLQRLLVRCGILPGLPLDSGQNQLLAIYRMRRQHNNGKPATHQAVPGTQNDTECMLSNSNEENCLAVMYDTAFDELNVRLTWWNRLTDLNMALSTAALFGYNVSNTTWGYFIQLSDLGNAMTCMYKDQQGKRHTFIRNSKGPSAGADQTAAANSMINKCHAIALIKQENTQISNFYATNGQDINAKTTSAQGWAMLNGSSVSITNGIIRLDRNVTKNYGLFSCYLEGGKTDASSSRTTNELATMESFMGNSGKSSHMQESNWISGGAEHKDLMKGNDLPVTMRATNRQNDWEPDSMKKGGRSKEIAAGVLDHLGHFVCPVSRGFIIPPNPTDHSKISQCGMAGGIRNLTEQDCQRSPLILLLRMLLRHIAYLQRTMTIPFVDTNTGEGEYTFHLGQQRISAHIRWCTQRIRRYYFDADETTAARTFDGAYCKSTLNPMHLQAIAWRTVIKACIVDPSAPPLRSAARDVLHGLLICPPSVHTIFGSLYLWLTQAVLDINAMVMACFCLYSMGFNRHCPIRVLACMARGLERELSPADIELYDSFCAFLTPLFCTQRGNFNQGTRASPIFATKGSMLPMADAEIRACFAAPQRRNSFSFDNPRHSAPAADPDDQQDTLKECQALHDQRCIPSNTVPTSYIVPDTDEFTTAAVPDFIEHRNKRDAFNFGSSDAMLAEIFAGMQTDSAKTANFWAQAGQGTRLQTTNEKSNDTCNRNAMPCQNTGVWYTANMPKAVDSFDKAGGLMQDFMLLCGLPSSASTLRLIEVIMAKYLERNSNLQLKKRFRDHEFHKPACQLAFYSFFAMPTPRHADGGIDVRLGMQVAWMILAQALYTSEWTGPREPAVARKQTPASSTAVPPRAQEVYPVVVHLRNMGHAARELLFMYLHLRCDKALLPRHSLTLTIPNPMNRRYHTNHPKHPMTPSTDMHTASASVILQVVNSLHNTSWHGTLATERLQSFAAEHTESHPDRGKLKFDPFNVLQPRSLADLRVINIAIETSSTCQSYLVSTVMPFVANYHISNVHSRCSNSDNANAYDIFPYPPESVAHMQAHHVLLHRCWRSYVRAHFRLLQTPDNESLDWIAIATAFGTLATACRLGLSALDKDSASVLSLHLTGTFMLNTGLSIEIPCVFGKHGFMCYLRIDANEKTVQLRSTKPTHIYVCKELIDDHTPQKPAWKETPLIGEQQHITFPLHLLNYALSHGFYYLTCLDNDNSAVRFVPPTQLLPDPTEFNSEHMVLTPWPAISFNQLLLCSTSPTAGYTFELDDGTLLRFVHPEAFFLAFLDTPHMRLISNFNVNKIRLEDPHSKLYCLDCRSITGQSDSATEFDYEGCVFFIQQHLPSQAFIYHYYISLQHLQHDLMQCSGYPNPLLEFMQASPDDALLFCVNPMYDPFDPETFEMFHVESKPGSMLCTVDICSYSCEDDEKTAIQEAITTREDAINAIKKLLSSTTQELRRIESRLSAYPNMIEEKKRSVESIELQLKSEQGRQRDDKRRLKSRANVITRTCHCTHTLPKAKLLEPGSLRAILQPYDADALQQQTTTAKPLADLVFACIRRYQSSYISSAGHYTVAYQRETEEGFFQVALAKFDFITASRALFPEGTICDVICTPAVFELITAQVAARIRLSLLHAAWVGTMLQDADNFDGLSELTLQYCTAAAADEDNLDMADILSKTPPRITTYYVLSDAGSFDLAPQQAAPVIALLLPIQGAASHIVHLPLFETGRNLDFPAVVVPHPIGRDADDCLRDCFEIAD